MTLIPNLGKIGMKSRRQMTNPLLNQRQNTWRDNVRIE